MKTKYSFAILALVLNVLLLQPAKASSSVWKVSRGGDYFYLGGTIHVLSFADYPLPSEFTRAYEDTSVLILETDMKRLATQAFQAKLLQVLRSTDGTTLTDQLSPTTYRKLKNFLDSRGVSAGELGALQPWGLSLIIALMEYERLGMVPKFGVDTHFSDRALRDGKQIVALETAEDQLNAIRFMENMGPNKIIEYTLRDIEHLPRLARFIKETWRKGNVEAFSTDQMLVSMKTDFPEMYDTLVTQRNTAWMKTLTTLFGNTHREFVLVGAMHLNGKEGLLHLLERDGFLVKQL
ncbi:MAG: TraB/GumN family protein [Halioglobus sp.]|nr:TraB/GumN family protein [Halioglobus sp.]